MVSMSAVNTLLQTLTPPHLQGRVMSLFLMMFMGTPPLGSLLAGSLALHIGAPLTVGITSMGCLGAAVWFAMRMHVLLEIDEEQESLSAEQRVMER
jgi:MFS family permease